MNIFEKVRECVTMQQVAELTVMQYHLLCRFREEYALQTQKERGDVFEYEECRMD